MVKVKVKPGQKLTVAGEEYGEGVEAEVSTEARATRLRDQGVVEITEGSSTPVFIDEEEDGEPKDKTAGGEESPLGQG